MNISIDSLTTQVTTILKKNLDDEQARIVANYLVWAEMTGNKTQGIVKMIGTEPIQNVVPESKVVVKRDTKLSQLIDAAKNPAPLVAQMAVDVAIKKASEHGFAMVGVKNTYSSNGAQAYYVEQIAKSDLIGIMCSRSPAAAAAFGGIDPVFGTNPIGFGFPTTHDPLIFDAATSAMTFYGLVLAKARGESIPENMAIDKDGKPTNNPEEAMSGALLPFDRSYKGSGFAMVIEMICGPLLGGAWVDNKTFEEEWGSIIIAIDPELFIDKQEFKQNASDMIQKVKSSRTSPGGNIRLPGEHASMLYKESTKSGLVAIDDVIAKSLGIS